MFLFGREAHKALMESVKNIMSLVEADIKIKKRLNKTELNLHSTVCLIMMTSLGVYVDSNNIFFKVWMDFLI